MLLFSYYVTIRHRLTFPPRNPKLHPQPLFYCTPARTHRLQIASHCSAHMRTSTTRTRSRLVFPLLPALSITTITTPEHLFPIFFHWKISMVSLTVTHSYNYKNQLLHETMFFMCLYTQGSERKFHLYIYLLPASFLIFILSILTMMLF